MPAGCSPARETHPSPRSITAITAPPQPPAHPRAWPRSLTIPNGFFGELESGFVEALPGAQRARGDGAVTAAQGLGVRLALPPTPSVPPGAELLPCQPPTSPTPAGPPGMGTGWCGVPWAGGWLGAPQSALTLRGSQHSPVLGGGDGGTTGWTLSLVWFCGPVPHDSRCPCPRWQPHLPVPKCGHVSPILIQHCVPIPSTATRPCSQCRCVSHPQCSPASPSPVQLHVPSLVQPSVPSLVQPCVPVPDGSTRPHPQCAMPGAPHLRARQVSPHGD